MRNGPPKFIYFDLGNVLLTFDHQLACDAVAALAGVSARTVREILFDHGLQLRYERGEVTSAEFHELFCQAVGRQLNYRELHEANSRIFQLNLPILPLVTQLKAAGFRLGILSNTCEAHWDYIAQGRYPFVRRVFEVYSLSYQVRASKPERAIYHQAAQQAGVEPDHILFTDDRSENVQGAIAAGWDAVLYETPRQLATALRCRGVTFNY